MLGDQPLGEIVLAGEAAAYVPPVDPPRVDAATMSHYVQTPPVTRAVF